MILPLSPSRKSYVVASQTRHDSAVHLNKQDDDFSFKNIFLTIITMQQWSVAG